MDHYSIKENGEREIIHFDGVFQSGDVALCGHDLIGDSRLGWEAATQTMKKVNCRQCIKIVKEVKEIPLSEYKDR